MRQTLSGCRCISADCPEWNGGSNQKRRSVGNSAFMRISAIRNLSSKVTPTKPRPRQIANSRTRAVGRDHPSGIERVRTVRRVDGQRCAIVALLDTGDAIAPAQIDIRQFQRTIDQRLLQIILLKIDEGRHLVAVFRQQIEGIERVRP